MRSPKRGRKKLYGPERNTEGPTQYDIETILSCLSDLNYDLKPHMDNKQH